MNKVCSYVFPLLNLWTHLRCTTCTFPLPFQIIWIMRSWFIRKMLHWMKVATSKNKCEKGKDSNPILEAIQKSNANAMQNVECNRTPKVHVRFERKVQSWTGKRVGIKQVRHNSQTSSSPLSFCISTFYPVSFYLLYSISCSRFVHTLYSNYDLNSRIANLCKYICEFYLRQYIFCKLAKHAIDWRISAGAVTLYLCTMWTLHFAWIVLAKVAIYDVSCYHHRCDRITSHHQQELLADCFQ